MTSNLLSIASTRPSNIVFLCGAGISFDPPTNLPTVKTFVRDILNACGTSKKIIGSITHLIETESVISRFEVLIDEIRKLHDPQLKIGRVFESTSFNEYHSLLAQFLLRGASVLTTNFDNCIENALGNRNIIRVLFTGEDLLGKPPRSGVLIKIHGSNSLGDVEGSNLVISIKALAATSHGFARFPRWRSYLKSFLKNKTLIVIGYSGSDEFDVVPAILTARPKQIIWFDYDKSLPVAQRKRISNPKVKPFGKTFSLTYFRGPLDQIIRQWASQLHFSLSKSRHSETKVTVGSYVRSLYRSRRKKEELTNTVLLNYGLYELVAHRKPKRRSAELVLQQMKALYRLGRAKDVVSLYEANESRFRSVTSRVQALYYYAASLYQLSDTRRAAAVAKSQLSLARKTRDGVAVIHSLNNLGGIYFALGQYEKSRGCYEESLTLQDSEGSIEGKATALWGLGDNAQMEDDYRLARKWYAQAQEIYLELGHTYNLNYIKLNLGVALTGLKQYENALHYLEEAERAFKTPRNVQGLIFVLSALCKLHYKCGRIEPSCSKAEEAVAILKEFPNLPIAAEIALVFIGSRLKRGDSPASFRSYRAMFSPIAIRGKATETLLLKEALAHNFEGGIQETIERHLFA